MQLPKERLSMDTRSFTDGSEALVEMVNNNLAATLVEKSLSGGIQEILID